MLFLCVDLSPVLYGVQLIPDCNPIASNLLTNRSSCGRVAYSKYDVCLSTSKNISTSGM